MWRSTAAYLQFEPEDGMKVRAFGDITVYERQGAYQLRAAQMFPLGVGELEIAFRKLKEKLAAEGLFDPEHKKELPAMPATVGVVTSPTGAAVRDIIVTLRRRWPPLRIVLYPVAVQGDGAARQIAIETVKIQKLPQAVLRRHNNLLNLVQGPADLTILAEFPIRNMTAHIILMLQVLRQTPRIDPIGLHPVDFLLRDQMCRGDNTINPVRHQQVVKPKTRKSRLIDQLDRTPRILPPQITDQVSVIRRHTRLINHHPRNSAHTASRYAWNLPNPQKCTCPGR